MMQFVHHKKILLVLVVFVVLNFTNCSKDDTEKLTDGIWSLVKVDGINIELFYHTLTGGSITLVDLTLDFEEDGDFVYTYSYINTFSTDITEAKIYGAWEWETADEKNLILTEDDDYVQKFEVKELTKSKLILDGFRDITSSDWEMEFEKF